jgi:hypothetical protein
MDAGMSDSNKPNLSIWMPAKKPFGCRQHIVRQFEVGCVDINRHNFPEVSGFHLRPHMLLINLLSEAGMLFLTIAWLSGVHGEFVYRGHGATSLPIVYKA